MNRLAAPCFDPDLLARHDRPGPRYTSYPTAPQFSEVFGAADLRRAIEQSNEDPLPRALSLYVHVPFCHSPCFYCGCNRVISRDAGRAAAYRRRVEREIDALAPAFAEDRSVVQLHFGGGTPNSLPNEELAALVGHLRTRFRFSTDERVDLSIEIDPRTLAPEAVAGLHAIGFNRLSLGVQDLDPVVQVAVNRVQPIELTRDIMLAARSSGLRSINIDLIYGLPKQSLAGFEATLDQVIELRPDRIAVYSYAHMPAMFKAQKKIAATDLPSPAEKIALLGLAVERLQQAGYAYIGMDHFALPFDELANAQRHGDLHRNFMGYTTHAETDLVGFGVSAISRVGNAYAQNPRDLPSWEAKVDAGQWAVWRGLTLVEDDVVRGDLIQSLMCQGEVDVIGLGRRHGVDTSALLVDALPRLAPLEADGLVKRDGETLRITARGRLLARVVAACFDRYAVAVVAA